MVDDHEAIRFAVKAACQDAGFDFAYSAASVKELFEQNPALDCDVVVLDLSLADGSIVTDNVKAIQSAGPEILIFSIADRRQQVAAALKAGAAALVRKSQSLNELMEAIQLVSSGVVVNNTETSAVIDADSVFKETANLTKREREVLSLYASGFAMKQVAHELGISPSTAKEYIDRVRTKYAESGRPISSKSQLLLRAIEDGIIDGVQL